MKASCTAHGLLIPLEAAHTSWLSYGLLGQLSATLCGGNFPPGFEAVLDRTHPLRHGRK